VLLAVHNFRAVSISRRALAGASPGLSGYQARTGASALRLIYKRQRRRETCELQTALDHSFNGKPQASASGTKFGNGKRRGVFHAV
jgi:hypothetical protein